MISKLFKINIVRKFINHIYNRMDWENRRIFTSHFKNPNISFHWKVKLLNGKTIINHIDKNDPYQFKLGLEYYNISPQLCIIENIINETIDPSNYYLDIGSNQGMRSFTSLSTGRKTIMFEPNLYLNNLNKDRCDKNNFINYKIENLCISNKNGNQTFYFSNEPSMSSLEIDFASKKGLIREEIIKTITLDNYFEENKIYSKNPYIKIDVEGHEMNVISGAEKVINELKPTFLIEIFSKNHVIELFDKFTKMDYKIYGNKFGSKNILKNLETKDTLNSYIASDYLFVHDNTLNIKLKKSFNI